MRLRRFLFMESSFLTSVLLPFCLAAMMFGMGLSLIAEDFTRVLNKPKSTFIGICCQILVLPCLAFLLATFFQLKQELAVGLMILSLVPGAVVSNFFTYLAKGNVALSISLTALVSLITPFSLPFLLALSTKYFSSNQSDFNLPFAQTSLSLLAITIVPVVIGMFVRKLFEAFAKKCEKITRIFSTTVLFLIVAGLIKRHWDIIPESFAAIGLVCLLFNVLTFSTAYMISSFAGLSRKDVITIAIEAGFQSSAMALFIASTILGQGAMAIVPAVYSLVMFFTGGGLIYYLSKYEKKSELEEVRPTTHWIA